MLELDHQDRLPEDVKRVCELYQVETENYYDSSFDREFEERLKEIPLLKELAEQLENSQNESH